MVMGNLLSSFNDALDLARRKAERYQPPEFSDYLTQQEWMDNPYFQPAPLPEPVLSSRPAMDLGIGASGGAAALTAPPPVETGASMYEASAYAQPDYLPLPEPPMAEWTPAPAAPPQYTQGLPSFPAFAPPVADDYQAALPGPTILPDFMKAEGYNPLPESFQPADTPLGRLGEGLARAPQELASGLSFGLIPAPEPRYNIDVLGGPVGGDPVTGGFGGVPLVDSVGDLLGVETPGGVGGFGLRTLTDPYNFLGGRIKPTVQPLRVIPEGADDLERLLQQSLEMAKANPTKAREVFAQSAQEVGQQIDEAQKLASGFYRDTGHVTKRANKLSEAMDQLKGGGTRSGIVADTLPQDTREAILKSVGAAGLGGTLAGARGELDSDPTTTFEGEFGKGAVAGLAGQAGIRTRANVVEDAEAPVAQSPFKTFVDNVLSIPNASKRIQAGGDIAGAQGRQNLPSFFIDPKVWGRNTKRAARAFFEDPDSRGVMDEVARLPRFGYNDPALVVSVGGKEIAVPPMAKVLGFGDDFAAPGFEKAKDTWLMRQVEQKMPLGQRSQKAQEAALVGTATELRNQMIDAAQRAQVTDPTWYKHYGDIAKIATGYGDVPQSVKGISSGFYSLRNVAARLQTLAQPITKPGPVFAVQDRAAKTQGVFSASPRGVATRHAVRFGLGELANLRLLAAAGEASGQFEVGYDPLAPGFGRLTMTDDKGNDTGLDLLGGYGSLIKTMARSAAAAKDASEGKEMRYDPVLEWTQFMRYKMAGMPAALIDTAIANSELRDVEGLRSPFEFNLLDPEAWKDKKWTEWFVPFFASDTAQKLISGNMDPSPDGLFKEGALLLGQFAGLPVSTYPATASDERDRLTREALTRGGTYVDASGQERPYPTTFIDAQGQTQPIRTYNDLKAADPLAAEAFDKTNPNVASAVNDTKSETSKRLIEIRAEFTERQQERDDTLLTTDPERWRKDSQADNARVQAAIEERARDFGTYDRAPETLLDLANTKYHNAIVANEADGVVDWDAVDREVAKLSPQEQDLLFANRLAGETDTRKQYIRDLARLEGYFQQRDEAWARLQQANPTFAQYESLDAFRLAKVNEVMEKNPGYPRPVVENLVDGSMGVFTQNASLAGAQYLVQNRDLIPLLAKYGFSVPSIVAPLAGQPVGGAGR